MKKGLLLFLLFYSFEARSQNDTLLIGIHSSGWGIEQLIDSLQSGKSHHVMVGPELLVESIYPYPKSSKPYYDKAKKLLKKRMSSFSVLVIENPTDQKSTDFEFVKCDTVKALIYQLDLASMRSLKELILIGNDTDDILELPASFYQTNTRTIHCYCLRYQKDFQKNVNKKAPKVKIMDSDCESVWSWLDKIY